jgi:hypothetical protein
MRYGFLALLGFFLACSSASPDEPAAVPSNEGAAGTASDAEAGGEETGDVSGDGAAGATDALPPVSCQANAECAGQPAPSYCEPATSLCVRLPAGYPLGKGDGTPASVTLTRVYEPSRAREATDLAFNPLRPDELWVLLRDYPSDKPCTEASSSGCLALEGQVAIISAAGSDAPSTKLLGDPNAWHFMRQPTALAFGEGATFATCAEARTGNYLDDPYDYIGPTLWSSDLGVFAIQPPGLNGSHLDMLHGTPWCMGIAHEQANAYWLFNGNVGALDRIDFKMDHGPGHDNHADGEYLRYAEGAFLRVPGVPSHLEYHGASNRVFVADTGNKRVAALDAKSGTNAAKTGPNYDGLRVFDTMAGAVVTDVVATGTLEQPSGLAIHDDLLYVTDHATSRFYAYSLDGSLVRTLDIGLPMGTLAGLTFGADGKIYFVDQLTSAVYRIDPKLTPTLAAHGVDERKRIKM